MHEVFALNHIKPYKEDKHDVEEQDPQSLVAKPNRHIHVNHHEEMYC
jgi:hypothetical protein